MAQPTEISFTLEEILIQLLKAQDIHEGFWALGFEFAFATGTAGPNPQDLMPSAITSVRSVGIRKVESADGGAVDASVVNPK